MRDNGGDGEAPGDGSGAEIDRLARVAKSVAVRDGRARPVASGGQSAVVRVR